MSCLPETLVKWVKKFKECFSDRLLEQIRWPNGFRCLQCSHNEFYRLADWRTLQCKACNRQISITVGTIFEKTKTPLLKWFWMIFQVAHDKGGTSSVRLSKQLGMHQCTVWHILHKIRLAMSARDNDVIVLSGLIEIDEAYFGGRKRKTQVLVMVEGGRKSSGNLVMKRIFGQMPSAPAVEKVVNSHVDNESQQHFVSDCAVAHNVVQKMGHHLEKHKSTPESASKKLRWVHLAIMLAKRFVLRIYHGVSRKLLQKYLDEFCYRFNRRFKESQLSQLFAPCMPVCPTSCLGCSEAIGIDHSR